MKLVLAGGAGHLGQLLSRELGQDGHQIVVLSRSGTGTGGNVYWDGRTLGAWAAELDGADVVINLAGRSVNCRYTRAHLQEMMDSRVESTRVVGRAIEQATQPPRLWVQMSTATIYAHRFDAPNDETTGHMGGNESHVPRYWRASVQIAKAWERALQEANIPQTRRVALRCAIVMVPEAGGAFDVLSRLTRRGLGGSVGGGRQFVSWLHDRDFVRAVQFVLHWDGVEGPINLASPHPLPQGEFMAALRSAWGVRVGLPATRWMAEVGALFLRTETELVLKSRRVVPGRLMEDGFAFEFPEWPAAARELVARQRNSSYMARK